MKKLFIITLVCGLAACVWKHQHLLLRELQFQNQQLSAAAAELTERMSKADAARQSSEEKLASLRRERASRLTASKDAAAPERDAQASPPAPPDPSHQGGWPAEAAFFYLPKQYLTDVSYRLLNGDQLTDEAAALLGMSASERQAADKAFADLTDKFHRAEIQNMAQVDPPAGWVTAGNSAGPSAGQFDRALTYHIPDLTDEMNSAQTAFVDQLQQDLGPSRAQIIASAADSYLRQNMSDLGAGDRTVGFAWEPESDGTQSLWYAVADARNGEGAFQRVDPNLDPNSQIAYYARLFGVRLPGQ
jgi:hypothetical protein